MRIRGGGSDGRVRTIVNSLADCLEHLEVDRSSTSIVPIVLVFVLSDDAVRTLQGSKRQGRLLRYTRDDRAGVEREDGRVGVDLVGVQYLWILERFQDWGRKLG